MVWKTVSPGCGVWVSLMLFSYFQVSVHYSIVFSGVCALDQCIFCISRCLCIRPVYFFVFPGVCVSPVYFVFLGVCALDQCIYAVGGYDSTNQLSTVERYDVEINQWDMIAPMNSPRSALSVAVVNGLIYALGKFYVTVVQYERHSQ